MWNIKLKSQTIKVSRNGYTFQMPTDNMSRMRYFGGGGTSVQEVDPFAGTGVRELFSKFTNWLQPNVGGVTPYPGQMVPGPSNLQQQGFDVAQGLTPVASGGQQYFGVVRGQADPTAPGRALGMAEKGLTDVLAPFDPSTVTEGLKPGRELAMDTFFREFMPQLKENMVSRAGTADTGALDKLAVQGGRDLSLGLGAQAYPYLFQGQQNQLGRQQTGVNQAMNLAGMPGQVLGQAGQIGGMGTDMLTQAMNIGGMQRGITGEQMGEPYQKWQMAQPYNNPYAQMIAALSGSAPQMDYIAQQESPGLGSQLLPVLGMGLGGYFAGGGTLGGMGSSLFGGGGSGFNTFQNPMAVYGAPPGF